MTTPEETHHDEETFRKEWIVTPEKPKGEKEPIEFYDSLVKLLKIYEPADTEQESDKQFTTAEIIQAVEMHYNVPQGDPDARGIDGEVLVDYLESLGFKCVNTGGLMMQWLMKLRK